MNISTVVALNILSIWFDSAIKASNTPLGRKYAIRWRTIGLINHDRILNGRTILLSSASFSGAPK